MRVPILVPLSRLAALALAALIVVPAAAALAQTPPSLAELAQKEQERRKAIKASGKVYSNRDLPAPPAPAGTPAALPPPVPAPAEQKPAEAKKPEDEKDEAWWRARMTQAREELRRGEMFAEALQSRINGLSADAVNRDDPYQRAKFSEDRQKAIAELDRVKTEIENAKKQIADIEEEARRASVPPGWIR